MDPEPVSAASSDRITVDEFVAWVDRYVTPPMAALGFVVCSTGEGLGTVHRVALKRVTGWRAARIWRGRPPLLRARQRRTREFSVGFEGESGHELWVRYMPDVHTLDASDWGYSLSRHVPWDRRGEREIVDRAELQQRLSLMGQAIAEQGLDPSYNKGDVRD
jgi:hypothetical protein